MNIYCIANSDFKTKILFKLKRSPIGLVWRWVDNADKSINYYTDRYGPIFIVNRIIKVYGNSDTETNFLESDLNYGHLLYSKKT